MFKLSTVTSALATQLGNDSGVTSLLKINNIDLGTHLNMDADRAPWVGVFRNGLNYSPRSLGGQWQLSGKILVVCQAVDYKSGERCRNTLKTLVTAVITAIVSDETINDTVDIISNISVEYVFKQDERETLHFQSALINLDFEATDS